MRQIICITILFLVSVLALSSIPETREFIYREITDGKTEKSCWRVERHQRGAVLVCRDVDCTQIYHLNQDLHTRVWKRVDADSSVDLRGAVRDGDLEISGLFNGEKIVQSIDLEGLPWMQKYPYSLKSFVLSGREEMAFWALKYDDLKPYKLCAKRAGTEQVQTPDGTVQACKVRVSAAGWRSRFYSVHFWYRLGDGQFVRFRGVNGPPGTPVTEIVMAGETSLP